MGRKKEKCRKKKRLKAPGPLFDMGLGSGSTWGASPKYTCQGQNVEISSTVIARDVCSSRVGKDDHESRFNHTLQTTEGVIKSYGTL